MGPHETKTFLSIKEHHHWSEDIACRIWKKIFTVIHLTEGLNLECTKNLNKM